MRGRSLERARFSFRQLAPRRIEDAQLSRIAIAALVFAFPRRRPDERGEVRHQGHRRVRHRRLRPRLPGLRQHAGRVQILASTTNAIFGTQTFGITTGTSNCGTGVFATGTKNFVEANREALAKDISRGEGEAIGALTLINACQDSHKVGAALQKNFKAIFPSENASNDDVTRAILETLHGDQTLGCGQG